MLKLKNIALGMMLLSILFVSQGAYSQKVDSTSYDKNAVLAGALGHARGIFSLEYERMFKSKRIKPFIYTAGTGIGYTWGSHESGQKGIVYFPFTAGLLVGKGNHYGHVRVGYTGAIGQEKIDTTYSHTPPNVKNESAYIISVSYRYMKHKDFVAEISPMTLIWTNNPNRRFIYSCCFRIGGAF
jgi:hypothetical protein